MDACDKIETVPVSIWNDEHPRKQVPAWVGHLVSEISAQYRLPEPALRVMTARCPTTFGGRWFDRVCNSKRCYTHAIGIILHPNRTITKAIVCHEMSHYLSRMKNGDRKGHHDDRFYDIVEQVYSDYGVSLATAKKVESAFPADWEDARGWGQILR